jgi:translocation and assembly module TamA
LKKRTKKLLFVWCGAALLLCALPAIAADPVQYNVIIEPTGNATLDTALQESATLVSLRESAPAGAFALITRARADVARFQTVLGSFGYYAGQANITIDGRPLDDPTLVDTLDAAPQTAQSSVTITPIPGPMFHLRTITLAGDPPQAAAQTLALTQGQPAIARDVLAGGDRLQAALRAQGHAFAIVAPPVATLAPSAEALDVSFAVTPGPVVDLGPISFSGLDRLREDYVRQRFNLRQGERYDPARLDQARADLAASGAIATIRVETADAPDAAGQVPVHVDITERKLHAVTAAAAWSTDLGGNVETTWTHRDLFGGAEQLALSAAVTGLGGSVNRQPGYNGTAVFTVPDFYHRDQTLTVRAEGVREYLDAYDRIAAIGGVTLRRQWTPELATSLGITAEAAQFHQEQQTLDYDLLQLPLGVNWDSTGNPLEPTHGVRAAITATPVANLGRSGNGGFTILQGSASTYFNLTGTGRTVIALRGLIGSIPGTTALDLPPDQRFYAGGGGTIRGYRFQHVGPKFPDGQPEGGTAVSVGSIELRQRFGADWGGVLFADGGEVGPNGVPFSGQTRIGVGIGIRYYTSIGPLRADIAVPLMHDQKNDPVQLYLGLGQSF